MLRHFIIIVHILALQAIFLVEANAQSFEKGNFIINSGIKISVYNINDQDSEDSDDDDAASSYTIPIGLEYATSNKIGLGIEIGICNYFTGEDTITGAIAKANSFDVMLAGNFHWVRGTHVDLYSGLGLGISAFKYKSNDVRNSQFKSTGTYFRVGIFNARFFVSRAIAFDLHMGIPYMNFNNGRITDNLGSDYENPISFIGIDVGTGITFRF